jgi:hypothetical protein
MGSEEVGAATVGGRHRPNAASDWEKPRGQRPSPRKSLSVWSVEPVRPTPHRDHEDNQQGAADPPPQGNQPELVKVPRRLTVAVICLMGRARIRAYRVFWVDEHNIACRCRLD